MYQHPSCSSIGFFLFSWNKLYTGCGYGSFLFCICYCNKLTTFLVLAGESVTLHCDSRPSCTASWSVCETEPTLGTSIKSMFFSLYSLCCYSLSISRAFSISSVACFTCSAVWDARNFVFFRDQLKRKMSESNTGTWKASFMKFAAWYWSFWGASVELGWMWEYSQKNTDL